MQRDPCAASEAMRLGSLRKPVPVWHAGYLQASKSRSSVARIKWGELSVLYKGGRIGFPCVSRYQILAPVTWHLGVK